MGTKLREKVNSIADLRTLENVPVGKVVEVDSYYGDGNGGGNTFIKVTDTGQIDNGGTICRSPDGVYEAIESGVADIRQFGAKPNDDTFDNTSVVQSMINGNINIDCENIGATYYFSTFSNQTCLDITEANDGMYINFGDNFLALKFTDSSETPYVNARGFIRFTGGATKPSFTVGTIKMLGEVDYDQYITDYIADMEAETIAAGNSGKTGVGRFDKISDASNAHLDFQVAYEALLQSQENGNVIEGVQFLDEFGVVNVDYIYGESMSAQACRVNANGGSTVNIKHIESTKSLSAVIVANVDSGITPELYLNIDKVTADDSAGSIHLTSTIKEIGNPDGYNKAYIGSVFHKGASNTSKCHGAWDVHIGRYESVEPYEYMSITAYGAFWNAFNFTKSFSIDKMVAKGWIGSYPISNSGTDSTPMVVGNLSVEDTYYVTNNNIEILSGTSYNCKTLCGNLGADILIDNFRYDNPQGLDWRTMFGGDYGTTFQMPSVYNLTIKNSVFNNMFSFTQLPPYLISYQGVLDTDYLNIENVVFSDDVSTGGLPEHIIWLVNDIGIIDVKNIKFIQAGVEVTSSYLFRMSSASHRPFIKIEDVRTNNFYGITGWEVVGRGTLRLEGKIYKWRNSTTGVWYQSTTYPTSETDGDIINNGTSSSETGTVIDLSNVNGTPYNMGAAESATTYTTSNLAIMGNAVCRINASSEPTVTGATKISGATFAASTDMHMVVQSLDGIVVQYYFLEL